MFFDVVGKVVDNFSSCQACVTVVEHASNYSCRGKRMIHSAIVRVWPGIVRVALEHRGCVFHHRSCHAAIKHKTKFRHDCGDGFAWCAPRCARKLCWSATQPHARSKLCWRRSLPVLKRSSEPTVQISQTVLHD